MEVTLMIPDDVADQLQKASTKPLPRLLLELVAIKAHELGLITAGQVQEMLGFESRWEVDALFKAYDVQPHPHSYGP